MLAENWLDICRDENGVPFRKTVDDAAEKRRQYTERVKRVIDSLNAERLYRHFYGALADADPRGA